MYAPACVRLHTRVPLTRAVNVGKAKVQHRRVAEARARESAQGSDAAVDCSGGGNGRSHDVETDVSGAVGGIGDIGDTAACVDEVTPSASGVKAHAGGSARKRKGRARRD